MINEGVSIDGFGLGWEGGFPSLHVCFGLFFFIFFVLITRLNVCGFLPEEAN